MELTPKQDEDVKEMLEGLWKVVDGKDLQVVVSVLTFFVVQLVEGTGAINNPEYLAWVLGVLDRTKETLMEASAAKEV